jgi:hypothetical protein
MRELLGFGNVLEDLKDEAVEDDSCAGLALLVLLLSFRVREEFMLDDFRLQLLRSVFLDPHFAADGLLQLQCGLGPFQLGHSL